MAVPKHPIAHDWIKQTLVPFLFHAFTATLPHPADISEQIERSIDFCHRKPDHPSDGDDLVFERIFMAIMHRHKDLEPELEMVVDNLEPLAKYLIRRAQLKGPYDLLGRTDIASGAWVEHERQKLADLVLEPEEAKEEICPLMRLPPTPAKLPPTEHDVDPRLVHAQQGQFAAEGLVGQLTADEDAYYRHQNQELENYCLRQQQQLLQHQPAAPDRFGIPTYHLPGGGSSHAFNVHGSPYQPPQQLPMQQTLQSPVHTRRGTPQQEKLWPTMTSAPQSVPQTQNVQPRPTAYGFFSSSVSTQPSTDYLQCPLPQLQPAQHPTTQFWAAQHQPSHHTAAQYPSAQPLQSIQNYVRAAIPAPSPQVSSPQSVLTPSRPALASGQVSNTFPSSDSAHLRGSDWSDAAQQRARESASKITAHERDTIAQGIIERQQAMVQQSSALTPTASMYSPTKTISHMPTRSHSATEYTSTPATASGMQTPAMPAKNSWGMAMPSSDSKPGLPTLEQVRSRYRPQQQQQRRRPGTASSAMPQLCDYLHGATEAPAMPLTSTALATPSKQWQSSMPTSKDVQWSLPQPLEQVVSRTDINAFAPTSHGGLPTPSPSTGDSGFSGQEHEHVYMENM